MRKFSVYQKIYLGTVEVPDVLLGSADADEVIEYMESNDCWPHDDEVIDTIIDEVSP